jgi:hypothetical protein
MLAHCLPEVAEDPRRRSPALILLPNGTIRAQVPTGAALEFLFRWHRALIQVSPSLLADQSVGRIRKNNVPALGEMMFVVFAGQEVAGVGSIIEVETRTVRDCNVHGDAWVHLWRDCYWLLCELAEQ